MHIFVALFVSFFISHSAQAQEKQSAEEVYNGYISAIKNETSFKQLNQYLSQELQQNRQDYIDLYISKKDISAEEVEAILLQRSRENESCAKDRNFLGTQNAEETRLVLVYKFDDRCLAEKDPNAFTTTIEEVHMINEDGWKVDHVQYRIQKPVY